MEVCKELDLLGSFSHPPISLEVGDQLVEEFHDFLSLSLPATSTSDSGRASIPATSVVGVRNHFPEFHEFLSPSLPAKSIPGRSDGDQGIQQVAPVSLELSLSTSPPAELPRKPLFGGQREGSLATFPSRLSCVATRSRYPALRPRKNSHHQKPPIRPIRLSKRSAPVEEAIIEKEELPKVEIAASGGLLMLADQEPWKITKVLKDSDFNSQSRLLISKALVKDHIIPHLDQHCKEKIHSVDGLSIRVRDCDTNEVLELKLKWWSSSRSYVFVGGWRKNFVKRRLLNPGDKIGLFWNSIDNMLIFSVLQQAGKA